MVSECSKWHFHRTVIGSHEVMLEMLKGKDDDGSLFNWQGHNSSLLQGCYTWTIQQVFAHVQQYLSEASQNECHTAANCLMHFTNNHALLISYHTTSVSAAQGVWGNVIIRIWWMLKVGMKTAWYFYHKYFKILWKVCSLWWQMYGRTFHTNGLKVWQPSHKFLQHF
jgi:hypothetical protein